LIIENNKVICNCGKDLGKFKEGKIFFCKKCSKSGYSPETYGIEISIKDILGEEIKE